MKRLTMIVAAAALTGCQTAAPTGPMANPFMGRSTVPPPATASPPPGATPYYGNGQLPPAVSGNAPLTPPGSNYGYQGSSIDRSSDWRAGSDELAHNPNSEAPRFESSSSSATQEPERIATRDTSDDREAPAVIRASAEEDIPVGQPAPSSDDSASTSRSVIRIVEPAESTASTSRTGNASSVQSTKWEQQASRDSEPVEQQATTTGPQASFAGFRGSASDEPGGQTSQSSSSQSSSQRYAHDRDYTRLSGRLEYSNIDRVWKLRYIPAGGIDGDNDEFGGSVILPDVQELDQFESGDFVEIEGEPLPREANDSGYAPRYDLRRIASLN